MLYHSGRDGSFEPVDMSTFENSSSLNDQEDFISVLHDQLEQQDIPIEQIHCKIHSRVTRAHAQLF
eukprot:CCRYP_006673-RA/>CCRYP_006673-RA protein AED:0.40 eAED:0.40 QI:0/-1/0/1/-1/0/1/0/65